MKQRVQVLLLLFLAQTAFSQELSDDIQELVEPHADAGLFSGVVLIARGDDLLAYEAFGFANWEHRVANASSTRFSIGSIAKTMTLNIVDALVARKQINLTDPVNRYIPEFPDGPEGGVVTIEHLVNHRAGVPHRVTSAAEEAQALSAAEIVDKVASQGLSFEPGSDRLYSSAGYTVLARVLELATDGTFDELLAEHVFAPAGMLRAQHASGPRLMPWRASPYRLGSDDGEIVVRNAPYKDLRFLTGAGSVYATAEDLRRYISAVRDGQFSDHARSDLLGDDSQQWQGIYGRTNGFEASVDVLDASDLVFVLLTNLQSVTTGQVRSAIQNLLTGGKSSPIPFPPAVTEQYESPDDIVGVYGRAEIHVIEGALFRGENEFYPTGDGYYIPGSGTRMKFRRGTDGFVDALISTSLSGRESILPRSIN